MGEVTRYEPACEEEDGFEGCSPYMEEYADGDYVKFTDHDAALRRAKAEVWRETAKQAHEGAMLWSAGMKEREAAALDEFAVWLDARAAQIEEGA